MPKVCNLPVDPQHRRLSAGLPADDVIQAATISGYRLTSWPFGERVAAPSNGKMEHRQAVL